MLSRTYNLPLATRRPQGNRYFLFRIPKSARRGAILILVLWLVLILSLIGLSYSSTVRTGVTITGNRAGKVKARYYAKAGIERTINELLMLMTQESYYSETIGFYDDETRFANQPIGDGSFSLLTGRRGDLGQPIYGITDETGRLNLNTASQDALLSFPEITTEMSDALADWRDSDYEPNPEGAEEDYYQMLDDPYPCKNQDLQTINELLLVRSWTTIEVSGEDTNNNNRLDQNEDDADLSPPLDDADGEIDLGLSSFFTVYSRDKELDPGGQTRLDLNSATQQQLQQIEGMTETQARSIVAWRSNNKFASLADLFNVTQAQQTSSGGQSGQKTSLRASSSQASKSSVSTGRSSLTPSKTQPTKSTGAQSAKSSQSQQKAFTYDQIARFVDWVCVGTTDKRNRININTAPLEVLMALPGMTEALASEILTRHQSSLGAFMRRSDLRDVNGMTEQIFRGLIDYITVQSYQFRIIAEGREGETKTVVETVVDLSTNPPRILYWRES